MENKRTCPYCGKEIKENAKFCMYCGKSITETIANVNENQVVNKTEEKTEKQNDIQNQLENLNKNETENINTPPQSENTNVVKPIVTKSKKPKKVTLVLLIVAVLCIAAVGVFQILRLTNPNIAVKVAKTRVINDFKKDIEKYNSKTSIYNILKNNEYNKQQKEISLSYDKVDFEGDNITKSLLNKYLKGVSINVVSQEDKNDNVRYDNVSIKNDDDTVVEAQVYASAETIALSVPQFYDKILGANLKKSEEDNSDASKFLYSYGNMLSSRNEVNECFIEQSIKLYSNLFNICDFKKDGRKTYVSSIENDDLIEITSDYLKELFKSSEFKQYIINSMVTSQSYTIDEANEEVDDFEKNIDDGVKKLFNEMGLSDVELSVTADSAKINNITLSSNVMIDGEKTKLTIDTDINSTKEEKEVKATISLEDVDLIIDYVISNSSDTGSQSLKLTAKQDKNQIAEILIKDEILESDMLEATIDVSVSASELSDDDVKFSITAKGEAKNKEKVNLDNVELKIQAEGVEASLGLKGSIVNEKASKIKKVNKDDITFLEELDDDEVNDILNEILEKIQLPSNALTDL